MLRLSSICIAIGVVVLAACNTFDKKIAPPPQCKVNSACTDMLGEPSWCVNPDTGSAACVPLMSEDCLTITGDPTDDNAILIATLLSITGAQASTNIARQQSAILAVEEINQANASGGILQSSTPGDTRKLVMLSCDEIANLPRAVTHLVTDLQVPAIIGPNLSQDTLDVTVGDPSRDLPSSAQGGTALISPAAVASAIVTVPDNGLTFQMVPADIFRIPLMKSQINDIEAQIIAAGKTPPLKIGIYYRDDAFGQGTADALSSLTFNGMPLATNISLGHAREDKYSPALTTADPLVASYATFAPDIIVVVGTGEIVTDFMVPLEAAWSDPSHYPQYVATDSTKVPGLLTAVKGAPNNFVHRVRGTGVLTTPESAPVFSAFQVLYGNRWKDAMGNPQPTTISNMGHSYDAVFAIALSLVGQTDITGATVAAGMHTLASLSTTCTSDVSGLVAPCYADSDYARTLYSSMGAILDGTPIQEIGTFAPFTWDDNGAKNAGIIEVWCINSNSGGNPIYFSSGLKYDVGAQTTSGSYTQCP
jgi:ABC-type branched-subunit amino acid transport system substrate-binding protein